MKMFLKIIKYRFTASLKHPVVIVCLSAAMLFSVLVGVYAQKEASSQMKYPIAIVDEDGGEYAQVFINKISENEQVDVVILSREKAQRQVATGKIDGAFVLLNGFSEKIDKNDFSEIIEFMTPSVTTSAYPVSEIVSSEIIGMWLERLVQNRASELYDSLDDKAQISYDEMLAKLDTEYFTEDIIYIEFIGDKNIDRAAGKLLPVDKAVGVYAAFVIFAIMLSGEWIFNLKKRSLQNRFISGNTSLTTVCLGSQAAAAFVSTVFFIPLLAFLAAYLHLEFLVALRMALGMFLFSVSIGLMAFVISTLVENLTQLVVVGTSASIINILLSSLAFPVPEWASDAGILAKALPGTYLAGCYYDASKIWTLLLMAGIWIAISYAAILRIKHKANK